jgi:hypothetical protein
MIIIPVDTITIVGPFTSKEHTFSYLLYCTYKKMKRIRIFEIAKTTPYPTSLSPHH